MPVIESKIDVTSESFAANRADMLALIDEFRGLENKIRQAGETKRELFTKRGQILPRERLALLLDPRRAIARTVDARRAAACTTTRRTDRAAASSPASAMSPASAAWSARPTAPFKGGTSTPMGVKKSLRAQQIALENKLPMVRWSNRGGANLLYQAEIFVEGGRGFANQARMSAAGHSADHASCTARRPRAAPICRACPTTSSWCAARRKVFLAGPPLLKAATGEIATDEELGGADMHADDIGLGEYLAEDDADGIRIAREVIARLPWNDQLPRAAERDFTEPRYEPDELAGVVPVDYRKPYDVREVIARIVDDSEFLEFKALYGTHTVCGHARDRGPPGRASSATTARSTPTARPRPRSSSSSAASRDTPIVYLQNTTGYMVGTRGRAGAASIKHGSKMIQAVANATVPQITIMSAPRSAPATTACAGAASIRASSSPGPTTASRSWAASRPPRSWRS